MFGGSFGRVFYSVPYDSICPTCPAAMTGMRDHRHPDSGGRRAQIVAPFGDASGRSARPQTTRTKITLFFPTTEKSPPFALKRAGHETELGHRLRKQFVARGRSTNRRPGFPAPALKLSWQSPATIRRESSRRTTATRRTCTPVPPIRPPRSNCATSLATPPSGAPSSRAS